MELDGVVLGGLVAVSLVGDDVDQGDEAGGGLGLTECLFELLEVVAVDGAEVLEADLGPEGGGHDDAVEPAAEPFDESVDHVAGGDALGEGAHASDHGLVFGMGDDALAPSW